MKTPTVFDEIQSKDATFERCELTPAQEKAWLETRTALLWGAPAFSNILYSMMADREGRLAYFTKGVPIAGTDDKHMFLNPDTFFALTLEERIFAAAHEIMHAILNHCGQFHMLSKRGEIGYMDGKRLPVDGQILNIAADLVINDLLIESNIGKFKQGWLHDKSLAVGDDSVIDAYRKVYEAAEKNGGKGSSGKGFDEHLKPGTGDGQNPTQAQQDRNSSEWGTAVAAAAHAARVRGTMPAALDRFFKKLLEPQINWAEHIRSLFARKLGNSSFSWNVLDQQLVVRGIGAPGRQGFGANKIIVGVDTSGSISQGMMDSFMREVAGIIDELNPKSLYVVQVDAAVAAVDECTDSGDLFNIKMKGGGGTDFRPLFDLIENELGTPDAAVYLTDGYGCFPDRAPAYPIIWGSITPLDQMKYPFGEAVYIPISAS